MFAHRYLFADDNVVILTHRETATLESGTFPVHALDVKVLEVFDAGEAAEALAAFGDPTVRVKRVERVAVFVGKADSLSWMSKLVTFGRLP